MQKGTLYLIPNTLGDTEISNVIPSHVKNVIDSLDEFIVENEKSARQFLKKVGISRPLQEMKLYPLNEHTSAIEISSYIDPLLQGKSMGILSEAGCPGIADPGAEVVKIAHSRNIKVVPLVGPSSILLALIASGLNGQNFAFIGYLPRERSERGKKIKEIEKDSFQKKQTQLFIEAPYRNQHVLEDILQSCEKNTLLCIATDITLPSEFIATKTIAEWQKKVPDINKRPTIFIIQK